MTTNTSEKLEALQNEIEEKRQQVIELRKQLPPEPVKDETFQDWNGNDVKLSSLFDERDELLVIHNMGKGCAYCTLWADGFNGIAGHLNNRMPFVVVSPDAPKVQKEFAEGRGWKFRMLSGHGGTFFKDLGFENNGSVQPGVSAFIRKDGKIYRAAFDQFGPGDLYAPIWHFFDLFPKGTNKWSPKYKYA